jgi:hypothetical protein
MVVLGRKTKCWMLAAAALAVWLAGCSVMEGIWPSEKDLAFSHRLHGEQGLSCEDCHAGAVDSDEPGMPTLESCMLCHEGMEEEKPPEQRITALYSVDGSYRRRGAGRLPEDILFSHSAHAGNYALDCSACHADVASSDRVVEEHAISMAECSECHVDRGVGRTSDCATCHSVIGRDWSPPSHEQGWTELHGQIVRAGDTSVASNQCSLCHNESLCVGCHQEMMPRDHNNHWRSRGHGVASQIDRSRCWTCHRSDYCERCHSEARPRNHVGGWGSPTNRHCVTCHFPLSSQGCYTCHKSAPSHAEAPPKPSWHSEGMNCRQCHGSGSLPLPHPDSGTDCNFCHR